MLNKISWLQFVLGIAVGLFLYYSFILLRFYGKELRDFAQGKKGPTNPSDNSGRAPVTSPASPVGRSVDQRPEGKPVVQVDPGNGQVTLFPEKTPAAGEKPELFQVMETVIARLRTLVEDAVNSGITKGDLLDHIQEVLSTYHYLRATPYEVAINNFIARSCVTHFSLMLSDEDVARLWTR